MTNTPKDQKKRLTARRRMDAALVKQIAALERARKLIARMDDDTLATALAFYGGPLVLLGWLCKSIPPYGGRMVVELAMTKRGRAVLMGDLKPSELDGRD